ncbi:aspartic peptidase domain-containing protein [Mycena leptocephala]|nr:aspartic peptidase domain-containing protein [Mycena leptocephala]
MFEEFRGWELTAGIRRNWIPWNGLQVCLNHFVFPCAQRSFLDELLVDTGSANIWVGANKPYVVTSTRSVICIYPAARMSTHRTEFLDQVFLAGLVMPNKSIGVASISSGITGADGVLGIGPSDLTIGTLSANLLQGISTILETLFCQGSIPQAMFGIFMEPTTSSDVANGEITWGKGSTSLTVRLHLTIHAKLGQLGSPSSNFWGIDMAVKYGNTSIPILNLTAGIIDSGNLTLLIITQDFLAHDGFLRYRQPTGAAINPNTQLLTVPSMNNLQNLVLVVAGGSFPLSPNAQIWPRALNTAIGGQAGKIYLVIADLGTTSGQGLDFMLGMTFRQRYYTIYDNTNKLFGLVSTAFTNATTN